MTGGERAIRWGLISSLTVVTLIAIGVSYGHLYKLATANGETGLAAAVLPVTVDGLILACSLVIVTAARRGDRSPVLAWLMLLAGIGATLAGNVAHGIEHGSAGALVAGWPAVVAAGCFHMVIGEMRRGREADPVPVPDDQAEAVADPWDESRPVGMEQWEAIATGPPAIAGPVAGDPALEWLTATTDRVPVAPVAAGTEVIATGATAEPDGDRFPDTDPVPVAAGAETDSDLERVIATARARFSDELAAGGIPSVRSIRQEIRVGYPRARLVREALTAR